MSEKGPCLSCKRGSLVNPELLTILSRPRSQTPPSLFRRGLPSFVARSCSTTAYFGSAGPTRILLAKRQHCPSIARVEKPRQGTRLRTATIIKDDPLEEGQKGLTLAGLDRKKSGGSLSKAEEVTD